MLDDPAVTRTCNVWPVLRQTPFNKPSFLGPDTPHSFVANEGARGGGPMTNGVLVHIQMGSNLSSGHDMLQYLNIWTLVDYRAGAVFGFRCKIWALRTHASSLWAKVSG